MTKQSKIPMHRNDDRIPEFSLMSKGLGENYLTDEIKQWHEADMENRTYCNLEGGKKISMPRYYRNKLYTEEQRLHLATKLAAKYEDALQKHWQRMYELHGDNAAKVQVDIDKNKFKKMYHDATKNRDKI